MEVTLSKEEKLEICELLDHWMEHCGWDFRSVRPWLSRRYSVRISVEDLKRLYCACEETSEWPQKKRVAK